MPPHSPLYDPHHPGLTSMHYDHTLPIVYFAPLTTTYLPPLPPYNSQYHSYALSLLPTATPHYIWFLYLLGCNGTVQPYKRPHLYMPPQPVIAHDNSVCASSPPYLPDSHTVLFCKCIPTELGLHSSVCSVDQYILPSVLCIHLYSVLNLLIHWYATIPAMTSFSMYSMTLLHSSLPPSFL